MFILLGSVKVKNKYEKQKTTQKKKKKEKKNRRTRNSRVYITLTKDFITPI